MTAASPGWTSPRARSSRPRRLPFTPGGIAMGGGGRLGDRGRGRRARGARRNDRRDRAAVLHPGQGRPERESHRHGLRSGLRLGGPRVRDGARRPPERGGAAPLPTPLATTSVVFAGERSGSAGAENGRIVRIDPGGEPDHGRPRRCTARSPISRSATGSVWVSIVPDDVVFRLSPDDGSVLATVPAGTGRRPCRPGTGCGSPTQGPRDRAGEHGRDTRASCHHRHALGGPLPRRPPVDIGRRAGAGRNDRDGQGAADPARVRRRRKRPGRPRRERRARSSASSPTRPAHTSSTTPTPRGPRAGSCGRRSRRRCPTSRRTAGHTRSGSAGGSGSRRPRVRRSPPRRSGTRSSARSRPSSPPGGQPNPDRLDSSPMSSVRRRTPPEGRATSAASRRGATRSRSG